MHHRVQISRLLNNHPIAFVTLVALSVLVFYTSLVDLSVLHIFGLDHSFNDQVAYVDAARHLLYEGRLTTGIMYPSTLKQDYSHNYMYGPGYATVVAASIWLFGDGVYQVIFPNILAYLISVILVFLIGSRLTTQTTGIFSALIFALFPANVVYATSAMSELTFLCIALLAFYLFLRLPADKRFYIGPLLLIFPFLFRETVCFLVIPMAFVILGSYQNRLQGLVVATVFLVLSFITLLWIYQWEWLGDRPSLLWQNLLATTFADKYSNAFFELVLPQSLNAWIRIFVAHAKESVSGLFDLLAMGLSSFQSLCLYMLISPAIFVLFFWWPQNYMKRLKYAYLALVFVLSFGLSFFYSWNEFIGVRIMLLTLPFASIVVAVSINQLVSKIKSNRRYIVALSLGLAYVLISKDGVYMGAKKVTDNDDHLETVEKIIQVIDPSVNGVFIAPYTVGSVFQYQTYPVLWSFIPANAKTFVLLDRTYPISTVLLPLHDVSKFGSAILRESGLRQTKVLKIGKVDYVVFKAR